MTLSSRWLLVVRLWSVNLDLVEHHSSRKKIPNNLTKSYGHRFEWIQQNDD